MKIGIAQCCCGHASCKDYWLTGIGKFVQGSGFTKVEAERIADLLNAQVREPAVDGLDLALTPCSCCPCPKECVRNDDCARKPK